MEKRIKRVYVNQTGDRTICPFMSSNSITWDGKLVKCIRMKCVLFAGRTCSLAIVKQKRKPSEYNLFARTHLLQGASMKEVAELWKIQKETLT